MLHRALRKLNKAPPPPHVKVSLSVDILEDSLKWNKPPRHAKKKKKKSLH